MDIPVQFEQGGKAYKGVLSEVPGAADIMWHLYIDQRYCGRLRLTNQGKFFFDENKFGGGQHLDYFEALVIAWYE